MGVKVDYPQEWTVFIEGSAASPPIEIRGQKPCVEVTVSIGAMADPLGRTFKMNVEDLLKASDQVRHLSEYKVKR